MTYTYIISLRFDICLVEAHINLESRYNPAKHGSHNVKWTFEEKPTRKTLNKLRNTYLSNWCFLH